MLTESALVTRRHGRRVELELQRGSACARCDMSQGCGTGALGRLLRRRSRPLVIETDQDCGPGDEVLLVLPESSLVRASLLVYGVPLLSMLVAGLTMSAFELPEWLVACAVIAGFLGGFRIAAFTAGKLEHRGMAPYIKDVKMNSIVRTRS